MKQWIEDNILGILLLGFPFIVVFCALTVHFILKLIHG